MIRSTSYNIDALDLERFGTIVDKKESRLYDAVTELIDETLDKNDVYLRSEGSYVDEEDGKEVEEILLTIRELKKDGITFHLVVDETKDNPFIVDFYPVLPAIHSCAPLCRDFDTEELHDVNVGLGKMDIGSERVFFHIEDYPLFRAIQKEEDSAELTVDVVGNFSSCRKATKDSEGEEETSPSRFENPYLSELSRRQDPRPWKVIRSKVFDVESVTVMGIPMYRMKLQLGPFDASESHEIDYATIYARQSFYSTPVKVGDFVVGKAWLQGKMTYTYK